MTRRKKLTKEKILKLKVKIENNERKKFDIYIITKMIKEINYNWN